LTRVRSLVVATALWTMFVWGTRVRNIAGDDDMAGAEKAFGFLVCALFIGAAIVMLALLVASRWTSLRAVLPVFAIATAGWWALRSVLIVVNDHSMAFRIVHIVLGLISSVLAVAAWRAARVRS
jgi:hypothetical protein